MALHHKSLTELVSFAETVRYRYESDTIIDIRITALILFMAPGIYVLLRMLPSYLGGRFDVINDYPVPVLMEMLLIGCLMISMVMYRIYSRLKTHSKRDHEWRKALIAFVKSESTDLSLEADLTSLNGIDGKIQGKEKFWGAFPALLIVLVLLILTAFMFVIYIPDVAANNYIPINKISVFFYDHFLSHISNLIGVESPQWNLFFSVLLLNIALLVLQAALIFRTIVRFPDSHEDDQIDFINVLQRQFSTMGIIVPEMPNIAEGNYGWFHRIWKSYPVLRAVLYVCTLGLATIYAIISAIRDMNNHLMNQWTFEIDLLRGMTVDDEKDIKSWDYYTKEPGFWDSLWMGMKKRISKSWEKISGRHLTLREKTIYREYRIPVVLWVAIIFMIVICVDYCLSLVAMAFEMTSDYVTYAINWDDPLNLPLSSGITIGLVLLDLILLMNAANAALVMVSRRPDSWQNVTRSCLTFAVPLWISKLATNMGGFGHMFDFNPYITTGVLFVVLMLMVFTMSIKKFYTPVDMDVPKSHEWIRAIFADEI